MDIVRGVGHSSRTAVYELADNQLPSGSTLGGPKLCLTIKSTGAIERVWSSDVGATFFGTLLVRHYEDLTGMPLLPDQPGSVRIHPEHQEHSVSLREGISVRENVFVLRSTPDNDKAADPPAVYLTVDIFNEGNEPRYISTYAFADLRGDTDHDVIACYDEDIHALIAWNKSKPDHVRIIGCSREPTTYETTLDTAMVTAQRCPGRLSNKTEAEKDPVGVMHHSYVLQPGQHYTIYYLLSFSPGGRDEAVKAYKGCPAADKALETTEEFFAQVLRRAVVVTPNPEINRGVLWAKANMLRVETQAPTGWCFVNDPGRSSNSVGRDTAWFSFGANYTQPDFARESLLAYVRLQQDNGKIIEYYDVRDGRTEDYGLNINDDTPLIVMALWRHYAATGDKEFLKQVFPAAEKAARYILSQTNDQGLVWCSAAGTADYGIVGWRNVIPNYRLAGATTEVNSECYAALRATSRMAKVLGQRDKSSELGKCARQLKDAINKHLLDHRSGLYYLNVGTDGHPHSDITCDMVFPLLFGVAPQETESLILKRLSNEDFWTRAGMRTVPRDSLDYTPNGGWGLLGGVWVGVAFWYAFAAAKYAPSFMDHALSTTFRNYSQDPIRGNTVPGQFSEWLDGETLVNRGMMLSPWFPPRYIWAAVEGAAGVTPTGGRLEIHPHPAPDWKWMGVQNLIFRGKHITYFTARMPDLRTYSNMAFGDNDCHNVYPDDISEFVTAEGATIATLGFRRGSDLVLLAGSTDERTVVTSVKLHSDQKLAESYRLRVYDSLLGDWSDGGKISADRVRAGLVLQVEHKGFVVLDLTSEK